MRRSPEPPHTWPARKRRRVLERLFPGLFAELVRLGAVPADLVGRAGRIWQGGWLQRFQSGMEGLLLIRPLLEGVVRKRTLRPRGIEHGTRAIGQVCVSSRIFMLRRAPSTPSRTNSGVRM